MKFSAITKVTVGIVFIGGVTACGQPPAIPYSSTSPTSYSQDLEGLNMEDIGMNEMAMIEKEFSGTDSLDAFDLELSQVYMNDDADTVLGKIEQEL